MKQKITLAFIFTLAVVGLTMPFSAKALSGINTDDIDVKLYTKQGGDWFKALEKETDHKGVLHVKNVLPGKYRMEIDEDDEETTQYLAVDLRMLDEDGRRLKDKTDVDLYVYINGVKTFVKTEETDDEGWMRVGLLSFDTEYYIDVKDTSGVKKKSGELRIKTDAKIDDSDWFQAFYTNTEDGVLTVRDVLPGKYKFEAKDAVNQPFMLRARLLDDKSKRAENSKVDLYVYINKVRTFIGEVKTDDDGWIFLPNLMTDMKYKISVD